MRAVHEEEDVSWTARGIFLLHQTNPFAIHSLQLPSCSGMACLGEADVEFGGGGMLLMNFKPRVFIILAVLATIAGCAKQIPVAEVTGIVKLDGKPIPNVRIMFMPDPKKGTVGPISSGLSDDQGRYKLTCEDEREGAVIGWHKILVYNTGQNLFKTPRNGRRDDDAPAEKVKPKPPGPKVPEKYTASGKTPLDLEVVAGKNELEIPLNSR